MSKDIEDKGVVDNVNIVKTKFIRVDPYSVKAAIPVNRSIEENKVVIATLNVISVYSLLLHPYSKSHTPAFYVANFIANCVFELGETVNINNELYYYIRLSSSPTLGFDVEDDAEFYHKTEIILKENTLIIPIDSKVKEVAISLSTEGYIGGFNLFHVKTNIKDEIVNINEATIKKVNMYDKSYDRITLIKRSKIPNIELKFKEDEKRFRTKGFRLFKRRRSK